MILFPSDTRVVVDADTCGCIVDLFTYLGEVLPFGDGGEPFVVDARASSYPIASCQKWLGFLSAADGALPATPSATRGGLGGPGRRRPQYGYPTHAHDEHQGGRETEEERGYGRHNVDFLLP
jgi:hypothetical protein